MLGWDDALVLGTVGASSSAVNSALGIGSTFISDWLGDENRQDQADIDWENYQKTSALDWDYYSNNYAPYNLQLEKDLFDYTSAANLANSKDYYDYTYQKSIDSIADKKQAMINAGYNPILAVNGGVGAVQGSTIGSSGQVGAISSPHSSKGVNSSSSNPNVNLGSLSISELLGVLTTAKSLDKMDADITNVKANTAKTIAETEKPGAVGQAERSLEAIAKQIGESANSAWSQAFDFIKNVINPVKEKDYNPHVGPNWEYDKSQRKSIYVPNL